MYETLIQAKTLPEAYHQALVALHDHGIESPCPDYNTTQKEISATIHITNPLEEPMISKLFIGGFRELEQYRQEMLDGILDFEIDRGNWNYTYHDRMVNYTSEHIDQIQFVINELKRNPSSRRAVILIRDASDIGSSDPACLQHIQFFIRKDEYGVDALHCKVLFRSNDACKAFFMNAFALILLQERIANTLNVTMGTYTHRANSLHCYARDYKLLEDYVSRIKNDASRIDDWENALTYQYIDDWKDLMEECQPEIAAAVDTLYHQTTNFDLNTNGGSDFDARR